MRDPVARETNNPDNALELVYDGRCPVCTTYCTALQLDAGDTTLRLVDARQGGDVMQDITARGLDIDEGMVLRAEGKMYYGAEAMHEIARRSRRRGWTGLLNRSLFRTAAASRLFYPAGKALRNLLLRLLRIEKIGNLEPLHNTLKHQLGADWARLDPAVQARFDREPALGETIVYDGTMETIRRSGAGWLFATFTRIIGNPLTPFAGANVPMEVALYKKPGCRGVFWRRTYFYPQRAPYVVVSTKEESRDGKMLECVGGGFGMQLKVTAENGEMHFRSQRYFWRGLGFRLPLPHWVSPGAAHVIHRDIGGGQFIFSISMRHPQLGETFFQQGVFRRKAA